MAACQRSVGATSTSRTQASTRLSRCKGSERLVASMSTRRSAPYPASRACLQPPTSGFQRLRRFRHPSHLPLLPSATSCARPTLSIAGPEQRRSAPQAPRTYSPREGDQDDRRRACASSGLCCLLSLTLLCSTSLSLSRRMFLHRYAPSHRASQGVQEYQNYIDLHEKDKEAIRKSQEEDRHWCATFDRGASRLAREPLDRMPHASRTHSHPSLARQRLHACTHRYSTATLSHSHAHHPSRTLQSLARLRPNTRSARRRSWPWQCTGGRSTRRAIRSSSMNLDTSERLIAAPC